MLCCNLLFGPFSPERKRTLYRKTIACLGNDSVECRPGDPAYDVMFEVGRLVASHGEIVATGSGSGQMEAAAKGARDVSGHTIGYPLPDRPANKYTIEVVKYRGDSESKHPDNLLELAYGWQLANLLQADGFVVAPHGGAKTMAEFIAAVYSNSRLWPKRGKPIAVLKTKRVKGAGWDGGMIRELRRWGVINHSVLDRVMVASTPEEAVAWVLA